MLLKEDILVKLKKDYQKVLNVMTAANNTYCMLAMRGHMRDVVVHFNQAGEILYQWVFTNTIIDSFAMLSQNQCFVLETRSSSLTMMDFNTHKATRIPFNFKNEQTDQSYIDTFPDTRYLVIRENGRFNDNFFKLSYYQYPLTEQSKPFHVFESMEAWTYEYIVRKTNNRSQYCWFKGRHDENFQFYVYDLDEPEGKKLQKFTYPNRIGQPYGQNKVQTALKTMWQLRPYEYMLVCDTDRNKPQGAQINNNYVVDTRSGVIRQSKFLCPSKVHQDLIIDSKYMGPNGMFRTFYFENNKNIESPVYYIDNETEELVGEQTWTCSYKTKYQFPGHDGGLLVDCQYENMNVSEILVKIRKIMNPKEVCLFFALELNPQFDRDLLQDVVEMIDYSK